MENSPNITNPNKADSNPFLIFQNAPPLNNQKNLKFGTPNKNAESISKNTFNLRDLKPLALNLKDTHLPHVYKTYKKPRIKTSNFSKEQKPEFECDFDFEENLKECRPKGKKYNTMGKDDCYYFISSKKCINLNTPLYKRSNHGHKRFKVVKLNLIKKYKLNDSQNNVELINKYKEKYFDYKKEEDKEEYPLDYDEFTCNTVINEINFEFTKSDEDSDYFSI